LGRTHPHPLTPSPQGGGGFSVDAIRTDFPILSRKVNGRPLIYLDSAASAQKPKAVIDAMVDAMEGGYANVHRGLHTLANETTDAYEAARESVRRLLNADPGEIVFTKGGTESINLVAASIGLTLQAGDEIVISELEHHANILPWHFLRERKGVVLRWAPVTDDGAIDIEGLKSLIGPKTRGVAVTHMSNVTGWRSPARQIADAAHAAGAWVLFDGCQAVVHGAVDVKAIDADFYVFTGHKLYGPTGIGVLYAKAERLAGMAPYQGGGEMIGVVSKDRITYAEPPHRFEAGTPPILEAIGLGAAIEWLNRQDRAAIAAHEDALYRRAVERLSGHNWLRILGDAPGKGAILSFTVEGAHAHDIAQILDRYGVAVRAGTHCAEPLMQRFGVTSSARASFALYNTLEEADAFADALITAHSFFGR
jgi:cysteine desulfurase/selenocysteine lyase